MNMRLWRSRFSSRSHATNQYFLKSARQRHRWPSSQLRAASVNRHRKVIVCSCHWNCIYLFKESRPFCSVLLRCTHGLVLFVSEFFVRQPQTDVWRLRPYLGPTDYLEPCRFFRRPLVLLSRRRRGLHDLLRVLCQFSSTSNATKCIRHDSMLQDREACARKRSRKSRMKERAHYFVRRISTFVWRNCEITPHNLISGEFRPSDYTSRKYM